MSTELPEVSSRPESPKPREEVPFKEIYPDLDPTEPISVVINASKSLQNNLCSLVAESAGTLNGKVQQHYVRHKEPSEEEQMQKVEYDLDEEDLAWLELYNSKERKPEYLPFITPDILEVALDRLEKEWFELTKHIQKALAKEEESSYPEDLPCNICGESETSHMNLIVFCDGCDLAVHQECYGVPYLPEGSWLCRRCLLAPDSILKCIFCPNVGGAMKQTIDNRWAHSVCGNWIPEAGVANQVYQEPIDSLDRIPKGRWQLVCSICDKKKGACIQCSARTCRVSYHVSCAINNNYFMDEANLITYCPKHDPADDSELFNQTSKPNLAHPTQKRNFVPLALPRNSTSSKVQRINPIAPLYIVNKLLFAHLGKLTIRKKSEFIISVCKYWALKREEKGTPLLKRLRLEPWTSSHSHSHLKDIDPTDARDQFDRLKLVRKDLEKVRILCSLVLRREKLRLKRLKLHSEIFEVWSNPLLKQLQLLLDFMRKLDPKDLFYDPVDPELVPDYQVVIKNPICFSDIERKIESSEYNSLSSMKKDFLLLCDNALAYNKPTTVYAKTAARLKKLGIEQIDSVQKFLNEIHVKDSEDLFECAEVSSRDFQYFDDNVVLEDFSNKTSKNVEKSNETIDVKSKAKKGDEIESVTKKRKRNVEATESEKSVPKKSSRIAEAMTLKKQKPETKKEDLPPPKIRKRVNSKDMNKTSQDIFKDNDLVWAKIGKSPWFPGKIMSSKNKTVPDNIKALKHNDFDHLIQFFERDTKWAWVPTTRLQKFKGNEIEENSKLKISASFKEKLDYACKMAKKEMKR